MGAAETDYVLGTHDAEVERLRFQHGIWREACMQAWLDAGVRPGARVIDIGAGPGFASLDLAELVGAAGEVLAVERSTRFADFLAQEAHRRGLAQVRVAPLDLMRDELPGGGFDLAWCRWVACFVPDPALLVRRIAAALRPGGRAVFHEYHEYGTYRLLPPREAISSFVEAVFESWRAQGGEPDIGRVLPKLAVDAGLRIESVRPLARAARPGETLWNWPAGFARINTRRLVDLGIRNEEWARAVLDAVDAAERDPASVFVTPTVLELVVSRPDA